MTIYKFFKHEESGYNIDKVYKKGDLCVFLGKQYICTGDISVSENPAFSSNWDNVK
jgi:hypothetical protein